MKHFHDITLPDFVSIYAKGGPCFSTICSISASGRELRISERNKAINDYEISGCYLSVEQFGQLNSFFRARQGKQFAFRMKDYADYKLSEQILAIGDGISKDFPIFKSYEDKYNPYNRRVTKVVLSTVQITIGDQAVSKECIDEQGVINLDQPLSKGEELKISADFDVLVRFDSDNFEYSFMEDGSILIEDLKVVEVL